MEKYNYLEINENAIELRKKFGEDDASPIDIFSFIENDPEVTTVYLPLSDDISGMCVREKGNKIIVLNSKMSLGRQRFTIAHELCHLYYHEENYYVCYKDFDEKNEILEKEADIFASYFLAPYGAFKRKYEELKKRYSSSIENIVISIGQFFGLSYQATIFRLFQEKNILKIQYNDLKNQDFKNTAISLGFSLDLYYSKNKNKAQTNGKYIRLANEMYNNEKISIGKYEELLLDGFRTDLVYGSEEEVIND